MVKGAGSGGQGDGERWLTGREAGEKFGKKTRGAGMREAGSGGRGYGGRWLRGRGAGIRDPPLSSPSYNRKPISKKSYEFTPKHHNSKPTYPYKGTLSLICVFINLAIHALIF